MGNKAKLPDKLILTALLSSGITLGTSIVYIILCVVAIIYQAECDSSLDVINGSRFFITTLYRTYFQGETCDYAMQWDSNTTSPNTVLILVIITLISSVSGLAAACFLATAVSQDDGLRYINSAVYVYVGIYVVSVVVDVTLGTHFGIDQQYAVTILNNSSAGVSMNYIRDMLRLGSLLLMMIALKGIVIHIINIALVIALIVFLIKYQNDLKKNQHPIHKVGALNAFEQPNKRVVDNWPTQSEREYPFNRGTQTNNGYLDSEPSRLLERNLSAYSNSRPYERSDSWMPAQSSLSTNRPFSYLEEVRRPVPVKSPNVDHPQWRDWPQPPPMPIPDYSPPNNRKLKPALKSNYMM